mmetsp:Transcript_157637/g.502226  ORF Transcript_157637/g.502226 Transcript_157637/m.502226 type:complete len:120 (+) Transcript_157637:346-705(+)
MAAARRATAAATIDTTTASAGPAAALREPAAEPAAGTEMRPEVNPPAARPAFGGEGGTAKSQLEPEPLRRPATVASTMPDASAGRRHVEAMAQYCAWRTRSGVGEQASNQRCAPWLEEA